MIYWRKKMPNYHIKYGYLKLVKFPDEIGGIPTFKEEQMKLERDEVEFLLAALKKYRKEKSKEEENA